MIKVVRKDGESVDKLCKRFKNKCNRAGVKAEIQKRKAYMTPGEKRRAKHNAAIRRGNR